VFVFQFVQPEPDSPVAESTEHELQPRAEGDKVAAGRLQRDQPLAFL